MASFRNVRSRIRSVPLGPQTLDGQTVELPPALIGSLGKDPKKKTILLVQFYNIANKF